MSRTSPPNLNASSKLKASASLTHVVTLGAGSAIGVSIFSILAPAADLAGPGLLIAMVLAVIPMVAFALIYAFLGSTIPTSGASFLWPSRYIHPFVGFIISWLRIVGSVAVMTVVSMVLLQYLSPVFDIPLKLGMFVIITIVFVVNLLGIFTSGWVQNALFVLLFVVFGIYVAFALPKVDMANFDPFLPHGWSGVFAAVPLLVSLFLSIESATDVSGEIKNVRSVIAKGLLIAIGISIIIYGLVAFTTIGLTPSAELASSDAPLSDGAAKSMGSAGSTVIILGAVAALGTTLNATFLVFSRFLFAMSTEGVIPNQLARVNSRFGTPHRAIILAYLLCLFGLLLPSNLIFLFLAVNIPTVLKYAASSLVSARLPVHWPELYERAMFKFSRSTTIALGYLGVAMAVLILVLGFDADWKPYALLGAWGAIGTVYWLVFARRSRHHAVVYAEEISDGS